MEEEEKLSDVPAKGEGLSPAGTVVGLYSLHH